MFLTVRYLVEDLATKALMFDLMQYWSDSCESVARVLFILSSGRTITQSMMSGLINDLDMFIETNGSQRLFD